MANCKKVVINHGAVTDLLNSAGVVSDLERRCSSVERAANSMVGESDCSNPPFSSGVSLGRKRAIGFVRTSSPHGVNHNNKHNTLLKALGAGR